MMRMVLADDIFTVPSIVFTNSHALFNELIRSGCVETIQTTPSHEECHAHSMQQRL